MHVGLERQVNVLIRAIVNDAKCKQCFYSLAEVEKIQMPSWRIFYNHEQGSQYENAPN
jgi:hypothetical protein